MTYAFPPPAQPALPIAGRDELFPVRRVFCIGRNYAEHAREMGADERDPPFYFMKPADSVVAGDCAVPYPPATSSLHFEGELVVAMGEGGADIPEAEVNDRIFGYAVGIDLTRRDLQQEAKDQGRPWDMGKGFDNAAPCSAIHPVSETGHPSSGALWLKQNGETKQLGDISQMIWNIPESIAYLSRLVRIAPGDLIYTGTPAGVGPAQTGDELHVHVDGVGDLVVTLK